MQSHPDGSREPKKYPDPHYSPESHRLNSYPISKLETTLNQKIAETGLDDMLVQLHEDLESYPAYSRIRGFAEKVQSVYSPQSRMAIAFLDGSAIGLDNVRLFLPHLMPLVDEKIRLMLKANEDNAQRLNPSNATSATISFVEGIRQEGNDHFVENADNHSSVLEAIRQVRAYSGMTQRGLYEGFGFVMEQVAWAYRSDNDDLEREYYRTIEEVSTAYRLSTDIDRITGVAFIARSRIDNDIEELLLRENRVHLYQSRKNEE